MEKKEIKEEVKRFKGVEISYDKRIKEDKVFLLSLIDDPVKTFRSYGYNADEKMVYMLNAMSENVKERAKLLFLEILELKFADDGCRACKGCQACELCGGKLPDVF